MNTTLGERVLEALDGPPRRTQRDLAAACGINPVSVNDWVKGRTLSIEGRHLLAAATFLGVNPRWLSSGVGLKRSSEPAPAAPMSAAEDAHWRAIADHVATLWGNNTISPTKFLLAVDKLAAAIPMNAAHEEVAEQVRRYLFDLSIKSLSSTNV